MTKLGVFYDGACRIVHSLRGGGLINRGLKPAYWNDFKLMNLYTGQRLKIMIMSALNFYPAFLCLQSNNMVINSVSAGYIILLYNR